MYEKLKDYIFTEFSVSTEITDKQCKDIHKLVTDEIFYRGAKEHSNEKVNMFLINILKLLNDDEQRILLENLNQRINNIENFNLNKST